MRQFVLEETPDSHGCVTVSGKKCHYLKSVLRVKSGDMIYGRLPDGTLQQMTVCSVKENVVLQVAGDNNTQINKDSDSVKASPIENKLSKEIVLFQFIAKPPKMELIIRQATECGVTTIVPVKGTFCQKSCIESAEKRSSSQKDDRWQRIIVEALQQCGSAVHTKVTSCMTVKEACEFWKDLCNNSDNNSEGTALVLYEQSAGTKNFYTALKDCDNVTKAALAVGAEGGISPEEINLMQQMGFTPVHLTTNILRCETASLYGIAALQTALMEKTSWQFKE